MTPSLPFRFSNPLKVALLAGVGALALAGCQEGAGGLASGRSIAPIPQQTLALMDTKGMSKYDPILIRSFKKESEVEVWKRAKNGQYALLKTYPICRWSGQLGPKVKEGDRQAPEGFYTINPSQMNPNSAYYLSFDTGYPNAYDRARGRTGANLMVHGACSSAGCFSMTDEQIAEIYAIAREAFAGGQRGFQFQSYPFRMTAQNLASFRADPNMPFWKNLKEGNDNFEVSKVEPKVGVCGKKYVFNYNSANKLDAAAPCPDLNQDPAMEQAVAQKEAQDNAQVAEFVAKGTPAVRLVYQDGDQHPSFKQAMGGSFRDSSPVVEQRASRFADVSRPEALAYGPQEIVLDESGRPRNEAVAAVQPASVQPAAPVRAALPVRTARASEPVVAAPAPQAVASATSPVVATPVVATSLAASAPSGEPFYKRLLSPFSGLGGAPAPAMITPPDGIIAQPVNAPLPPRRQASAGPAVRQAEAAQ